MEQFKVNWIDRHADPKCSPNPAYPTGIDLDVSKGFEPSCTAPLPYPAKRIGYYLVECNFCGTRIVCTTAGRPDDPRSIKISCDTSGLVPQA